MFNISSRKNTKTPPPSVIEDITERVQLHRVSEYQYESAGFGGSADIFRGTYTQKDGKIVKVAVKCIRADEFNGEDPEYEAKMSRKLKRELEIWHTLNSSPNIIQLLGTITGIGPLPSPVCELCTWNLKEYLGRTTPPPKHIKMMTDTLKGLSYMHELKPNPIVHGDIKSHNILVTADERAMLCDFGRSKLPNDQPRTETKSSPFGATLRYMSPELFAEANVSPTPASDMWAYGCVALEILCRIQPYHEIVNDYEVIESIKKGRAPSKRPRGNRARLVNDSLWEVLATCWREQSWRPTSRAFLDRMTQLLEAGEVSASPVPFESFPTHVDGQLVPWPKELDELSGLVVIEKGGMLTSSQRSNVWRGILIYQEQGEDTQKVVVVKVPRLHAGQQEQGIHDQLQNAIRKTMHTRYEVKHRNIINILGIDSSFDPHPGLIIEYCAKGNLTLYCRKHPLDTDTTSRPSVPLVNAYSLISDILEGLHYMHTYPVPIPQGDLTPDNILIGMDGTAKIGLFSFGRVVATIPTAATLTASVGPLLPFRWMSPELLLSNKPTTASDMWAIGCVGFWILTGLKPYAGHLRDDFAGVESVRGLPPGTLANIDQAHELSEHGRYFYRDSSWVTNGIWDAISKCWNLKPSRRLNAASFLSTLKSIESKAFNWMPTNVADLAGKVKVLDPSEYQIIGPGRTGMSRYSTTWKQWESEKHRFRDHVVDVRLFKSTYSPNWYSKNAQVVIKQEWHYPHFDEPLDTRAYISSHRHEVAITAQLDHSNICKLLGIDSSHERLPWLVFEYCSDVTLNRYLSQHKGTLQDHLNIVKDIASALAYIHDHPNGTIVHGDLNTIHIYVSESGQAKLSNFTCAFQYIPRDQYQGKASRSSVVSTKFGPSVWRSPEYYQREGEHLVVPIPTTASDMWSFGCIIANIFTGDGPFSSVNKAGSLHLIGAPGIPVYSPEQWSRLDDQISAIVRPMVTMDPSARPCAGDVLKRIIELL